MIQTSKTGEESTATTTNMNSSTTSTETIHGPSVESLSPNYNPPDPSPRVAQPQDTWNEINRPNFE